MEGWNPSTGCTMRCGVGCRARGWVPAPPTLFSRRDAFIDAVGRTDNPCERPARYLPCCKPVPKFRLPQEQPACNMNCYREEQAQARYEDCIRKQMESCCWGQEPDPCFRPEVTVLDPCLPVVYQQELPMPPSNVFYLRERPCRTDIIAGFFNPDDNKSPEQLQRETCDAFYRPCGPGLKPYPCRGVITFPPQRWVSQEQDQRTCYPSICEGSKYVQPDYVQAQAEAECRAMQQKQARELAEAQMKFSGCTTGRCGCD